MTNNFEQKLYDFDGKKNPPAWASKANYYFENKYGEQWIAYVEEGQLYVSGADIGWKVMQGDLHDCLDFMIISEDMKNILKSKNTKNAQKVMEKAKNNSFFKYSLNSHGENTWLCSVMEASIEQLEEAFNEKGNIKATNLS